MIRVIYHRQHCRVTILGHAHSGEAGHDLACSAVSILAYTAAANVLKLEEAGAVRGVCVELGSGNAQIACNPVSRHRNTVRLIMDAVTLGFELLAKDFPQYVSWEILG